MSVDEYTNAFTYKMEFSFHLLPDELTKFDKFEKGLPWVYSVAICQAPTLEVSIWVAKSVEDMIKGRNVDKDEVNEKRKSAGLSKANKKSRISKSKDMKSRDNEVKWCDKCRRKHFGGCIEEVTCFKCWKIDHNTNECTTKKEVCFKCAEEGHFKRECPKKKGVVKPNV